MNESFFFFFHLEETRKKYEYTVYYTMSMLCVINKIKKKKYAKRSL
jgi:hypothetical protein